MESQGKKILGKQSSKPLIGGARASSGSAAGARPASGSSNRPRDPRTSYYQGQLASAKYIGESAMKLGPRRASAKASRPQESPQSVMGSHSKRQQDSMVDMMNQSSTSFHSVKQLDQEQREKLQKQTARPFVVG